MEAYLVFGAFWSLLLLTSYLSLPRWINKPNLINPRYSWVIIIGAAALARMIPALILPMGAQYDIQSYQVVGKMLLEGKEIYANTENENRYPYLPFWMYWSATSEWLSNQYNLPLAKTVKILPVLADIAIAGVLYAGLNKATNQQKALYGGMSYALNPIPVFVCSYHGQFDSLPILSILLSLFWLEERTIRSGCWLGLGILIKSWPILTLPSILSGVSPLKKKFLYLFIVVSLPILGILIYAIIFKADPGSVIIRALNYNHGMASWGYSYFAGLLYYLNPTFSQPISFVIRYGRYLTLAGLALLWLYKIRKESPSGGVLTTLVAFFAITHAFATQYLGWLVPFAILNDDNFRLRRYTLAAFAFMFLIYNTLILEIHIPTWLTASVASRLIISPLALPIWLITVLWAVQRIKNI